MLGERPTSRSADLAYRATARLLRMPAWAFVFAMTGLTIAAVVPIAAIAALISPTMLAGPDFFTSWPLFRQVIFVMVLFPMFETAVSQWIPISICRRVLRLSRTVSGTVSAVIFGLLHTYSTGYVGLTFVIGLVLSLTFFLAEERKESPYWMVSVVHGLRNGFSLAVHALG